MIHTYVYFKYTRTGIVKETITSGSSAMLRLTCLKSCTHGTRQSIFDEEGTLLFYMEGEKVKDFKKGTKCTCFGIPLELVQDLCNTHFQKGVKA